MGGHNHLLHSNIDWGQDLIYLREWIDEHRDSKPLYLAYYGYVEPSFLGIEYEPAPFPRPRRRNNGAYEPKAPVLKPGLYAISVNFLRGADWQIHDGKGGRVAAHHDAYADFLELTPAGYAGYSIYIYDVSETDIARLRGLANDGN